MNDILGIIETPRLRPEEIEAKKNALASLLPADQSIAKITPSWRNLALSGVAELKNGDKIFIKCHDDTDRTIDDIRFEHDFYHSLLDRDFQTARPLEVYPKDNKVVEIFAPLKGQDTYRDRPSWTPYLSADDAFHSGRKLAQWQEISAQFTPRFKRGDFLTTSMDIFSAPNIETFCERESFAPVLGKVRSQRHALNQALSPHLKLYKPRAIRKSLIHGDWHPSNMTWDDNRPCEIFDLSLSSIGDPMLDFATAVDRAFIDWLSPANEKPIYWDHLRAFIEGFGRKLAGEEIESVLTLLPLCHVQFALSEYRLFLTRGEKRNALYAWDGYLLGHALYYSSPYGQDFLNELRRYLTLNSCN